MKPDGGLGSLKRGGGGNIEEAGFVCGQVGNSRVWVAGWKPPRRPAPEAGGGGGPEPERVAWDPAGGCGGRGAAGSATPGACDPLWAWGLASWARAGTVLSGGRTLQGARVARAPEWRPCGLAVAPVVPARLACLPCCGRRPCRRSLSPCCLQRRFALAGPSAPRPALGHGATSWPQSCCSCSQVPVLICLEPRLPLSALSSFKILSVPSGFRAC